MIPSRRTFLVTALAGLVVAAAAATAAASGMVWPPRPRSR